MTQLTWLVTGCSSGFGEQFVHSVLSRGDRVIATGRHASTRLAHLKDTGAAILDLDVSAPPPTINDTIAQALKVYGGIDVLVNNAGFFECGAFEEQTHDRLVGLFNTNFFGPVNLTKAMLPHFRERKGGFIVYVSSQVGWQAEPGASSYCASKYALAGIAESIGKEVAMFGVKTITFDIGMHRTQVFGNVYIEPPHIPEYTEPNKALLGQLEMVHGNEPGDPKKAVERMIDVVRGEGAAEGRTLPLRLPIGRDSLKIVREKCQATLETCREWEDIIASTDVGPAR